MYENTNVIVLQGAIKLALWFLAIVGWYYFVIRAARTAKAAVAGQAVPKMGAIWARAFLMLMFTAGVIWYSTLELAYRQVGNVPNQGIVQTRQKAEELRLSQQEPAKVQSSETLDQKTARLKEEARMQNEEAKKRFLESTPNAPSSKPANNGG